MIVEYGRLSIESLKRMEWAGAAGWDGDIPACPVCKGIRPDHKDDITAVREGLPVGHQSACEINEQIENYENIELAQLAQYVVESTRRFLQRPDDPEMRDDMWSNLKKYDDKKAQIQKDRFV